MGTKQLFLPCAAPSCNATQPHSAETTNHVAHGIGALLTGGLWLPFWFLIAIGGDSDVAVCSKCGNKRKTTGAATLGQPAKVMSLRTRLIILGTCAALIAAAALFGEYL